MTGPLPACPRRTSCGVSATISTSSDRRPTVKALRLHILVVQKDPDSAQSTAIHLHLAGHQVRFATDGSDADEMLKEHWPDAVLVDIDMRGGWQLVQSLRDEDGAKRATVVALTGLAEHKDRVR